MNTIVGATIPFANNSDTEPANVEESRILMIKDFIYYSNKPFTSLQIVAEIGICNETVKKYLQKLIKSEYIKQIGKDKGKNVYVFNKAKQTSTFKVKSKKYTIAGIEEEYRKKIKKMREEMDLL
jgi:predicted transcriptional regulator